MVRRGLGSNIVIRHLSKKKQTGNPGPDLLCGVGFVRTRLQLQKPLQQRRYTTRRGRKAKGGCRPVVPPENSTWPGASKPPFIDASGHLPSREEAIRKGAFHTFDPCRHQRVKFTLSSWVGETSPYRQAEKRTKEGRGQSTAKKRADIVSRPTTAPFVSTEHKRPRE